MSIRFTKAKEIIVGRQYHLNQVNKHKAYLLVSILDEEYVIVKDLENVKKKDRKVKKSKLLSTNRYRNQ